MKKVLLMVMLSMLFLMLSAEFVVNVEPGLLGNKSIFDKQAMYLGYRMGVVQPYLGSRYLHTSMNYHYEYSDMSEDGSGDRYINYESEYSISGRAIVFAPEIGVNISLYKKEKISFNGYASLYTLIPKFSGSIDDYYANYDSLGYVTYERDTSYTLSDISDEFNYSINGFGWSVGLGSEYYFNDNLSMSFLYGINYLHINGRLYMLDEYDSPTWYDRDEYIQELKALLGVSDMKFILNFYY